MSHRCAAVGLALGLIYGAVGCGSSDGPVTEESLCRVQGEVVCSVVFSCLSASDAREQGFGANAAECAQLYAVRNSCDGRAPICNGGVFDPSAANQCLRDIEMLGCAGLDNDLSPDSCDLDNVCSGSGESLPLRPVVITRSRVVDGQEELLHLAIDYEGGRLASIRFTDQTGTVREHDTATYDDEGLLVGVVAELSSGSIELRWQYDQQRRLAREDFVRSALVNTRTYRYGPLGTLQTVTSNFDLDGDISVSTHSFTYDDTGALRREDITTGFERRYSYEQGRLVAYDSLFEGDPSSRFAAEFSGDVLTRVFETSFPDDGPPVTGTVDVFYGPEGAISSIVETFEGQTTVYELWYELGELEGLVLEVPGLPFSLDRLLDF